MSTTMIKRAWPCLLLALAFLAGCTDHGPVGLYSKELFNRTIAPPHISFNSASTALNIVPYPGAGSAAGATQGIVVNIVNDGGSATYGPVSVSFTCTNDGNFVIMSSTPPPAPSPAFSSPGTALAIFADSPGQEIPASSSSTLAGQAAYYVGSTIYISDATYSFHFYYLVADSTTPTRQADPTINMLIKDPLGNTWTSQFQLPFLY